MDNWIITAIFFPELIAWVLVANLGMAGIWIVCRALSWLIVIH